MDYVKLDVEEDKNESTSNINLKFVLKNTSKMKLDLSKLNIKYYYTKDSDREQVFNCYYA